MPGGVRIDDMSYRWLMEHRGLGTVTSVVQELIEFKKKDSNKRALIFCDGELKDGPIDFTEEELNLISCAVDKLDCSACILDCDQEKGKYGLCDTILHKIGE